MAIETGNKISTTGLVDKKPFTPEAPDMSRMKVPEAMQPKRVQPRQVVAKQEVAPEPQEDMQNKIQSLTDEDKIVLDTVLAPSVASVLKKIAPDASQLIDQFTSAEENVVLPVSVVKTFATKRYGGADEREAIESFIADLSATQEMDQQTVPPETEQPEDIDYSSIDTELV
jgi:peroxiredoxin